MRAEDVGLRWAPGGCRSPVPTLAASLAAAAELFMELLLELDSAPEEVPEVEKIEEAERSALSLTSIRLLAKLMLGTWIERRAGEVGQMRRQVADPAQGVEHPGLFLPRGAVAQQLHRSLMRYSHAALRHPRRSSSSWLASRPWPPSSRPWPLSSTPLQHSEAMRALMRGE